jgi:hypothetical protein
MSEIPSAYVSIRQHTSAYLCGKQTDGSGGYDAKRAVCARERVEQVGVLGIREHASACVSIRHHTSAYISIRQHTSAYVKERVEEFGKQIVENCMRP